MSKQSKSWFGRHKLLTIVGVVVLIAIAGGASSGDKSTDNSAASTTSPSSSSNNTTKSKEADSKSTTAKVGEAARDGKFEFVVKSVKCGVPSVSDSSGYITKTAQGQYCVMSLSVKNIGDKRQMFSEDDQKLLNASNQQYSPDTTATLYNDNNMDVFMGEINPGNSVSGSIVFDIPKGQTPVTAELHDSAFSDGVKVTLK